MAKEFDTAPMIERLKKLREEKDLRQSQLASLAGITPAALSQIENGSRVPTLGVVQSLANALGVGLDYLTGQSEKTELKDMLRSAGVRDLLTGYQGLAPDDQKMILKNIEFLQSKTSTSKKR